MFTTTDAAPELVQLRQTKALGVFNYHHARIGNIDADLEHSRADQRMRFAPSETLHDLLFLSRCHPAVKQFASERMQAFTPLIVFGGSSFRVQFIAFIN